MYFLRYRDSSGGPKKGGLGLVTNITNPIDLGKLCFRTHSVCKVSQDLVTTITNPINMKKGGFRSNDNLADLISRIRNGYFRSFEDILVIDSKQNRELLDSFILAGYIYN